MKIKEIMNRLCILGIILSFSFSRPAPSSKENRYKASIFDSSVSNMFDSLYQNQTECFLNNYSSTYFSNLHRNFGLNSHGSCSYVSLGMLLSFYDSYWNDGFVPESMDCTTTIPSNNQPSSEIALPLSAESPGIYSEPYSYIASLGYEAYADFVFDHTEDYFQCYLIDLSYNLFGDYSFDQNSPYAMSLYQQRNLIYYYLVYNAGITTNVFTMDVFDGDYYEQSEILESAVENVCSGDPVLLNISSNIFGNHSVVAYDYDGENLYVHSGWKDGSGRAITHVSLNDLSCSEIQSSICLKMTNSFENPNNYITETGCPISVKNFSFPSNVSVPCETYEDVCPEFRWDSIPNERWFERTETQYILSFGFEPTNPLVSSETRGNSFVISDGCWQRLRTYPLFETVYFCIFSQTGSFRSPLFVSKFSKPYPPERIHTIRPTDYGFSSSYTTSSSLRENFIENSTSSGFSFKTRRYRVGCVNNESIVLSPKRFAVREAFIEFQFLRGISRVDIDMSHYGPFANEGLDRTTGRLEIQEFRGRSYTTIINLLDDSVSLPREANNKRTIRLCFEKPTFRIRIYSKMFNAQMNFSDRGRVCVGDIKVFETAKECLPLNGWELNFDAQLWNNSHIRPNHNCYAYALNLYFLNLNLSDGRSIDPYFNPGEFTSSTYHEKHDLAEDGVLPEYFDLDVISEMAICDSDSSFICQDGYDMREIGKYDICDERCYKVALVLDTNPNNPDYHWYRQNADGSWSHKLATDEISCLDASGNIIYDPQQCDKNYISGHDYSDGNSNIKFFSVKPPYVYGEY